MNYSRIKKLMKVEVFCTEMEYPSPLDKDFAAKEEAYYASHAWRSGVVISKDDYRDRLPELVVSFSRALTQRARKGSYMLREFREGADFCRVRASRGYDFITVRPATLDKKQSMVKEVGYVADDIESAMCDIRRIQHDMKIVCLAYADVLTEDDIRLLEDKRTLLSGIVRPLVSIGYGWEKPITDRE